MATGVPPSALPPPASTASPAPTERGWKKLIFALLAFFVVPVIPQVRAFIPIDNPLTLFVTALAVCTVVGWRAGGRPLIAIAWVTVAVLVVVNDPTTPYENLIRGWSLLLAGAFGLMALVGVPRTFFARALASLAVTMALALVMGAVSVITLSHAQSAIAGELARRNAEYVTTMNTLLSQPPPPGSWLAAEASQLRQMMPALSKQLDAISDAGAAAFPALLALESLAALGLAWATYHRIARARLGAPLSALRDFRFNDGLVWGLIVGLVLIVLPDRTVSQGLGSNLIIFFGALYALRGLGILAWFLAPGSLSVALSIGFAILCLPMIALFGIRALGVAALGLGLGDTWVDWRRRPRSTT